MSNHPMLKFIAGTKPVFNIDYAILSAPVRHVFMMAVVWHLTKAKKMADMQILEVGSWIGASALSFAQGLILHNDVRGTITCVDAWKPFLDREKHNNEIYETMEKALGTEAAYQLFTHNVGTVPGTITCQHLRGQSEAILPLLRSHTFDIIFIDADHAYTPVLRDIKNSLDLIKEGGIICGDDLNLQLHQVDQENTLLHAEEDFINDPKTKRNYHPGVTLAVAEIFGEVSLWGGFWAMQKVQGQWKKFSLKGMPVHYPDHFPESAVKKAEDHFNDIEIA
jgi:predicted O-methyltransferase YrrM